VAMICYQDRKGRVIFVSKGIGEWYGTFYRAYSGRGKHRVKSPLLPVRKTKEEAEKDFADYVRIHGLAPVTVSHVEE